MAIFNLFARRKNFVKPCDFTKVIKKIETSNKTETWIATKDCWVAGCASFNYGYVKINGTQIVPTENNTNYGYVMSLPCLYVTRGSVIEVCSKSTGNPATMIAYGCM